MALQGALSSGVSGLTTYSNVISVIGNNIANVNTTGFKESRANFSDILNQSLDAAGLESGRGVQLKSVDRLFTQGGFQTTSVPTDLAIDGDGLFVLRDPATGGAFFSRTGNFTMNANGNLVNGQDYVLQGFDLSQATIASLANAEDINLSGQSFPPNITTTASLSANLDVNSTPPGVAFDATDAVATSNFASAITIFDSLGNGHSAEIYFQKQPTPTNTWNWSVVTNVSDLTGAGLPATGLVELASGDLTFTTSGALDTLRTLERIDYASGAMTVLVTSEQGANVVFDFADGAATGQSVTFDFGTPQQLWNGTAFTSNPAATTTLTGVTQLAASSATLFQSQDGFGSGVLQSFSVDRQGIVQGLFSNGKTRDLFQVALAKFPNPAGLNQAGSGLFSQSTPSGEPIGGNPGTSGLGNIVSGSLETSNVDLSIQFVELIRAQQAFQANARIITTSDELLTEVVNLRR